MTQTNPIERPQDNTDLKNKHENTWATLCHLSALAVFTAFIGIPFGNILGPLIIWLIKKDEMPLVREEGKSSLNFQISMTIYSLVAFSLASSFLAIALLFGLLIVLVDVVLVIVAAIKTSKGERFQYPCTIYLIK